MARQKPKRFPGKGLSMLSRLMSFLVVFTLSAVLISCGGTGTKSVTTSPTNPTPATPDAFQTDYSIIDHHGLVLGPFGTISIDMSANNGAGSIVGQSPDLGVTQRLQFCPYLGANQNCFDLVSFTPDNQGKVNASFTFPRMGTWAGTFLIIDPQGLKRGFSSEGRNSGSGTSFKATLLPASTITGGVGEITGSAPLTQGSAEVDGLTVNVKLTGTTANDKFSAKFCTASGPTDCMQLGSFTSDASGNATAALTMTSADFSGVLLVSDGNGVQFAGAFRVQ
jgi:hypothetical protein